MRPYLKNTVTILFRLSRFHLGASFEDSIFQSGHIYTMLQA